MSSSEKNETVDFVSFTACYRVQRLHASFYKDVDHYLYFLLSVFKLTNASLSASYLVKKITAQIHRRTHKGLDDEWQMHNMRMWTSALTQGTK